MENKFMPNNSLPVIGKVAALWKLCFLLLTSVFVVLLLHHHYQIVTTPVPLDYYEGAMPLITSIIADGGNPYTREYQPWAMDVYPPLYNLIVAPLSLLFGNSLLLHRLVAALFIFVGVYLCIIATRAAGANRAFSWAAGAAVYAGLIFYSTPIASTNAVGVALFLASVIVPRVADFSTGSLVIAGICGLLSFYAKQYFVVGIAILCWYLLLYVSIKRALLLGVMFAISLLSVLVVVHLTSPFFLDDTLFAPMASMAEVKTWSMVSMQAKEFLSIYRGYLLIVLIAAGTYLMQQRKLDLRAWLNDFRAIGRLRWEGPVFGKPREYFWFCTVWSTLAFVVTMGQNPGNYMSYVFQLISPFFLIASFATIARLDSRLSLLLPLVFVSYFQAWTFLPKDFTTMPESWAKIDGLIAAEEEIFASPMVLMSMLKHGKKIYQNGQTTFFPVASRKPEWLRSADPADRIETIWDEYMAEIYRKIEYQEFDLIITTLWDMEGLFGKYPPPGDEKDGRKFLRQYYYVDEKLKLSMTERYGGGIYNVHVLRPRR